MSYQHVLYYLATLGRSGWRSIDRSDAKPIDNTQFFGRFGIGFASVFSVGASISVISRQASSRSVDGVRVTFSEPDRPFFVEPFSAQVGTQIDIDLRESMSVGTLKSALSDLFSYLPSSIHVDPAIDVPRNLEQYSLLKSIDKRRDRADYYASRVSTARLAGYPVQIKVELAVPRHEKRKRLALPNAEPAPTGAIDVVVDGVRVFKQDGLSLERFGEAKESGYGRHHSGLRLKGIFVTIDFSRESAPVLPSRDQLDLDKSAFEELRELVFDEYRAALPDLIDDVASTSLSQRHTRDDILHILQYTISDPQPYWRRHRSKDVQNRAAEVYAENCPLLVHQAQGDIEELKLLSEIDPETCHTAVLDTTARGQAFRVYAQSRDIRTWIKVSSSFELSLLEDSWPYDENLRAIHSSDQLLRSLSDLGTEVRDVPLVRLLRSDYALISSEVFESGLYFYLPTGVSQVPRDRGISQRRVTVSPSLPPRVALNADHPLSQLLNEYLSTATEADQEAIAGWLDRFCQGVVEDKSTVRAPRATWDRLRVELNERTGRAVGDIPYESLKVRI